MRKEHRDEIALFRYQLVREAADPSLSTRQRGPLVRALATMEHPWPYGGTRRYSRETLDRWIKAWQQEGFDGLKPEERAQGPVTDARVLLLAETLKRERPNRTAAQVKRIITETLGAAPSETTLLRHFRAKNISTGVPAVATGRFETDHSNEIWVGDALHGPRLGGRKTYLFAFLDDPLPHGHRRPLGLCGGLGTPLRGVAPGPANPRHPLHRLPGQRQCLC
ncbi:helix-turn-helix domain-containing protein [Specibacter cremeus]|uniref:helix-turn-helix domain-containing protein n=1 Tax=Specibacter cremeus TaxID=1629051 RepID=UPI003B82CBF5